MLARYILILLRKLGGYNLNYLLFWEKISKSNRVKGTHRSAVASSVTMSLSLIFYF